MSNNQLEQLQLLSSAAVLAGFREQGVMKDVTAGSPDMIEMIRRLKPQSIAEELVNVQPLHNQPEIHEAFQTLLEHGHPLLDSFYYRHAIKPGLKAGDKKIDADGREWVCTDPEIDRWVSCGCQSPEQTNDTTE